MYNMNNEGFNAFISSSTKKNFSIILIDCKTTDGEFCTKDTLQKMMDACKNFFVASYVTHHMELTLNGIVCCLNYDQNHFNVSAFADSLQQMLFSLDTHSLSYIYYSESFLSVKDLLPELDFLFQHAGYGILFGSRQPIPSGFLHRCSKSINSLDRSVFPSIYDDLSRHSYDFVVDKLHSVEHHFHTMLQENHCYSFSELSDYIAEVYYNTRLFFRINCYSAPSVSLPLPDALIHSNGIAGLLHDISIDISDYTLLFHDISVADRTRQHVQEILTYIETNISTVSLPALSAHFDLTPAYICHIFKQDQKINFTDYVKKKRFQIAAETLQTNMKITISELSKQLGYKSQSYFQNSFKKEFGVTPDAYRKQYHKSRSV